MDEDELTARITRALADPDFDDYVMAQAILNQNAIDAENAQATA
jgi:hypothetical protein